MIAPLGIMGGRLALGDAGGVNELRDGAAIFEQGRVPVTRAARLSKIRVFTQGQGAKRRITVDTRPARAALVRLQAAFLAEVAAGRETWLAFSLMLDRAVGVRLDDLEGNFIRGRALSIIRKRSARLGVPHSLIWGMERDRHRGLHIHALAHATSGNHRAMRQAIREGFGSACEADIEAPAFKFHTPIHRVAGPAEAGGWLAYSLSGLVAPGAEVSGIRGKPGCVPLAVKAVGISRARGNA
jgi:hypothetical protein